MTGAVIAIAANGAVIATYRLTQRREYGAAWCFGILAFFLAMAAMGTTKP